MTKEEFDQDTECFDPQIRMVVEMPNGQEVPIKGLRYDYGMRDEAVVILETGKPRKRR